MGICLCSLVPVIFIFLFPCSPEINGLVPMFPNIIVAILGVLGNRGIRSFISGEQGNKSLKLKGTREQRQFRGTGNIANEDFDFGEQGKMPFFFRGTREQVPPGRASLLLISDLAQYFYPHPRPTRSFAQCCPFIYLFVCFLTSLLLEYFGPSPAHCVPPRFQMRSLWKHPLALW